MWFICEHATLTAMTTQTLEIRDLLAQRFPQLGALTPALDAAVAEVCACHERGGLVMVCGNGGSAADSGHIVGELMKGFMLRREVTAANRDALLAVDPEGVLANTLQEGVRAVSLTDASPLVSAVGNDLSWDVVYAQQVLALGRAGDVLIGLSTSGNARNVVRAMQTARALGVKTVGLTGRDGGAMRAWCNILLAVPETETYRVQELHLPLYHALCAMVEEELFGAKERNRA